MAYTGRRRAWCDRAADGLESGRQTFVRTELRLGAQFARWARSTQRGHAAVGARSHGCDSANVHAACIHVLGVATSSGWVGAIRARVRTGSDGAVVGGGG